MGVCTSDCGQAGAPVPTGFGIWNPTIPASALTIAPSVPLAGTVLGPAIAQPTMTTSVMGPPQVKFF